jgi:hypothetical protein
MQQKLHFQPAVFAQAKREAPLDLVVPFTTPELTRVALGAADRMGIGLNATLRLVRVLVVPVQLDLTRSPVDIDFLKSQLDMFRPELPMTGEIRLARDFEQGLLSTLALNSVVILASGKRLWKTRNQRLAESLRRAGYKVVLVSTQLGNRG